MSKRSEARTRKELIDPKLKSSGWWDHDWQVEPEYSITAGRIHFDGKTAKRANALKADYLLRYKPARAIAVVEAKKEGGSHLDGICSSKVESKPFNLKD